MTNLITVKNKIKNFDKSIFVSGDKSLSIRWVLFSSMVKGKSKAFNLLLSEDVLAAINAVRKLGAKVKFGKNYCTIIGNGPDILKEVSMVGNDMNLDSGVGTCGKDGQSVPVGVGQPTLKIDNIIVGGTG